MALYATRTEQVAVQKVARAWRTTLQTIERVLLLSHKSKNEPGESFEELMFEELLLFSKDSWLDL
jgi:hypothetical protein